MINYKSNNKILLELNFYYIYLFNNYLNFFFNFNFINNTIINKLFIKNFFFIKNKTNIYLNTKLIHKFNVFDSSLINYPSITNTFNYSKKNKINTFKLFNLIFLFNYSLFNSNFKFNHNFKLFYLYNSSKNFIIIDSNKFISRWKDSYDLIYNIFFFNYNPLIFSTKLFKKETLSLNWNYNYFDNNLWNYYFPFFNYKLTKYNRKSDFFFEKLSFFNINFFIITDCTYHFKNIHYMKKKNYFSIGLVNVNLDPWLVSYPIISFFDNFITQSFFFKFMISINKIVYYSKFFLFKNLWNLSKFKL